VGNMLNKNVRNMGSYRFKKQAFDQFFMHEKCSV
jgi:hypothetical protein